MNKQETLVESGQVVNLFSFTKGDEFILRTSKEYGSEEEARASSLITPDAGWKFEGVWPSGLNCVIIIYLL